jgi:hypothetical protein
MNVLEAIGFGYLFILVIVAAGLLAWLILWLLDVHDR